MPLWTFLILVLLGCLPCAVYAAESEIDFIKRFYARYSWEASNSQSKSRTKFIDEPRAELQKYLEPRLAEALIRDRRCVRQTREICRLDFSPMWASQDPGAMELLFQQDYEASRVKVSFTYPSNGKRIVIDYNLTQTTQGPRIKDVYYSDGSALSHILEVR